MPSNKLPPPEAFETGTAQPYRSVVRRYPRESRQADSARIAQIKGKIKKANPNHDERGRFTSAEGEASSYTDEPEGEVSPEELVDSITVYHGTAADALKSIQEKGLVPKGGRGGDAWAMAQPGHNEVKRVLRAGMTFDGRDASVFITEDPTVATYFGSLAAQVNGGQAAVLKIQMPKSRLNQVAVDELAVGMSAFRFKGKIPPEWISNVAILPGSFEQPMTKADDDELVTFYLALVVDGFEKANPHHDEKGRFTTAGGGGSGGDGGIKQYLEMVSGLYGDKQSPAKYVLEHGKTFSTDSDSFIGGVPQQCYKNASLAVLADNDLTYVEGYVSVHGVPIAHAWAVDQQGTVRDVTLASSDGIQGYFGVPIQTRFLEKTLLKNKVYGILTGQEDYRAALRLMNEDPKKVVAGV